MACNNTLSDSYQVAAAGSTVTLSVEIGYGQTAASTVCINGVQLQGHGPSGTFTRDFTCPLGTVRNGDILTITTVVGNINTNPPANKTSVTVTLTGGVAGPNTYPPMICDADNPTVNFDTTIFFV